MTYLKDFRERIAQEDYPGFLKLWEEYCYSDEPDPKEFLLILEEVKNSSLATKFGSHVERGLALYKILKEHELSHKIFKLIYDIQNTNSDTLGSLALQYLENRYGNDPKFQEKLRLIGLRSRENFQGAISNYDLLTHMEPKRFVFHTGGWGTGEVIDISLLREEVTLEFDFVAGPKSLSFANAFKTLIPLEDDHFLSRRFGAPDELEKYAKEKPIEVIRLLLKDLGPKNAAEIKEELCDLVIPADEWNRWWQTARSKIKKDTKIETPKTMSKPFYLLEKEIPHEVTLYKALETKPSIDETIQMVYSFMRDFPETLKNKEFRSSLFNRLTEALSSQNLPSYQKLQLHFFIEDLTSEKEYTPALEMVKNAENIEELVKQIEIVAFKKRILVIIQKTRKDWVKLFFKLLFNIEQNLLRDYILSSLDKKETLDELKTHLNELLLHPISYPEMFFWYFQKIIQKKSHLPYADDEGKKLFFESFFILLDHLGQRPAQRDLAKKMLQVFVSKRYEIVREIFRIASVEEVKEYLLLATKCQIFSDHDLKIVHSLAEVVYPSLGKIKDVSEEEEILWTTEKSYLELQNRIKQIATVETVENAREIEAARALGDLRENAEFKAALERRDRLQGELKLLSTQLNKARILTAKDVTIDKVGPGSIVECTDAQGKVLIFTILGPFDADVEKNILSLQSKLAQAMKNLKIGEKFQFQNQEFTVTGIENYFDQK